MVSNGVLGVGVLGVDSLGGVAGEQFGTDAGSFAEGTAVPAAVFTPTDTATLTDLQTSSVDVRDGSKGRGV